MLYNIIGGFLIIYASVLVFKNIRNAIDMEHEMQISLGMYASREALQSLEGDLEHNARTVTLLAGVLSFVANAIIPFSLFQVLTSGQYTMFKVIGMTYYLLGSVYIGTRIYQFLTNPEEPNYGWTPLLMTFMEITIPALMIVFTIRTLVGGF